MTTATQKISIRLDARLHDKLKRLVDNHPRHSMTAVIDELITAGLSGSSTAEAHVYLEAAVANLAVMLELLRPHRKVDPEAFSLVSHSYGMLLELIIEIEGVEQ